MNEPLITRADLEAIGAKLDGDVDALLTHLNDTLDQRVGAVITEMLSDDQLKELVDLQEKGDDEAVGSWIEKNVAELQQIAEDERDILLGELAENADNV